MKTPITTIAAIELSSLCSNQCEYCPAPGQSKYRPTGFMDMDIYKRALEWVKHFTRQGTQREINMHGIGESTMHPDFIEMTRMARDVVSMGGDLTLATNGNHLTDRMMIDMIDAGMTHINLTGHKPRTIKNAVPLLNKYSKSIKSNINMDFALIPNNWAGQVEGWVETVEYKLFCGWLDKGRCMVYSDGRITSCALDAHAQGIVGDVWSEPGSLGVEPFKLCETCHHELPEKYKNKILTEVK